jgi:hypothetical protein
LTDARALRESGPRLNNQLEELQEVVRRARVPVRLQIRSDGATQVSVVGIGELGTVRDYPLDLFPGRYVLVGKKSGFQDVRQEVVLTGHEARLVVDILPGRSLEQL